MASDGSGTVTLHRGGFDGPVIGTKKPCTVREGCTDVHFVDSKSTLSLQHKDHYLPPRHSRTHFSVDDKKFHWKGYDELVEDDTKRVVAKFHSNWWQYETHNERIGRLEVSRTDLMDIIVFTAMIVEERAEDRLPPFYQL